MFCTPTPKTSPHAIPWTSCSPSSPLPRQTRICFPSIQFGYFKNICKQSHATCHLSRLTFLPQYKAFEIQPSCIKSLFLFVAAPNSILWIEHYESYLPTHLLKDICISGINPTWSWFSILCIYCYILFANIVLIIFAFLFMGSICMQFGSVFGFDIRVMPAH